MSIGAWLWNFTLLFGCAYIVFGLHRSPWWFALAIAISYTTSDNEGKKKQAKGDPHV